MANIELYINGELCDTPKDLNIRLNRLILKPDELQTKDAQYSYAITLPATGRNNDIFGHVNIEEVGGKFKNEYSAELIINSVQIFKGRLRLSEIGRAYYKGNLYIPELKAIKDIFGNVKMTDNAPYPIQFREFAQWVNYYNNEARAGRTPAAIFPFVLYGLLPKAPTVRDSNAFTARDLWDETVKTGITDYPPSLNVLTMLRHLFNSRGYNLKGTAFNDERLTRLYMSYNNPADYVQMWNYGRQAYMRFNLAWSNYYNADTLVTPSVEGGSYSPTSDNMQMYACDWLDATNTRFNVLSDEGGNILKQTRTDAKGQQFLKGQIRIPVSGYYKIQIAWTLSLYQGANYKHSNDYDGTTVISPRSDNSIQDLASRLFEIKLLRDLKKGDFGIGSSRIDGRFYYDNLPQSDNYDATSDPKYLPNPLGNGFVNFVDIKQNPNLVMALNAGYMGDAGGVHPLDPRAGLGVCKPQVLFGKPSLSWDSSANLTEVPRLLTNTLPFYKWKAGEGWTWSDKYYMLLTNAPYANEAFVTSRYNAKANASAVVWFEAGELLTMASVSNEGRMRPNFDTSTYGWIMHDATAQVTITPFRTDKEYILVNNYGNGTAYVDLTAPASQWRINSWNDPSNFDYNTIDLVKFLPSTINTDDFIDNLCKAFNLNVYQIDANTFALDVKQTRQSVSGQSVNLDTLSNVKDAVTTSLGLPAWYKVGFNIDPDEEGFFLTQDDGGGSFNTGSLEDKTVEQKSNFSFNWFKNITKTQNSGNITLSLPVISKHEVWDTSMAYSDAQRKRYTAQPIRFWYFDGLLTDTGATFSLNNSPLQPARVTNVLTGRAELSYKNHPRTILTNYFTLLIDAASHYTEAEAYLTPEQYEKLNGAYSVNFNGDAYYIAEVSAYDPTFRNKTKLRLIRKI